MNRVLRREFPPRKLKGLCGGHLHWRSPASLARERDMLARICGLRGRDGSRAHGLMERGFY
jgi:hypothetical protein